MLLFAVTMSVTFLAIFLTCVQIDHPECCSLKQQDHEAMANKKTKDRKIKLIGIKTYFHAFWKQGQSFFFSCPLKF